MHHDKSAVRTNWLRNHKNQWISQKLPLAVLTTSARTATILQGKLMRSLAARIGHPGLVHILWTNTQRIQEVNLHAYGRVPLVREADEAVIYLVGGKNVGRDIVPCPAQQLEPHRRIVQVRHGIAARKADATLWVPGLVDIIQMGLCLLR